MFRKWFFIDKMPGATHRCSMCGISVWCNMNSDPPEICGTNILNDWLLIHIVPWLEWIADCVRIWIGMEPTGGFMIKILETFEQRG